MAGRTRTTKKLAQRINLNYFKSVRGIPRWRRILSAVLTAIGLAWLGWHALAGSPKPYNAGPIAHAHALLGQKCSACHVAQAGFQRTATDQAVSERRSCAFAPPSQRGSPNVLGKGVGGLTRVGFSSGYPLPGAVALD